MQTGDHQMMENQKVPPAQTEGSGPVPPNPMDIQQSQGTGKQTLLQLLNENSQNIRNGPGPKSLQQVQDGQQVQDYYNQDFCGTIAGGNVAAGVTVRPMQGNPQLSQSQSNGGGEMVPQQPRSVYRTTVGQKVRYLPALSSQSNRKYESADKIRLQSQWYPQRQMPSSSLSPGQKVRYVRYVRYVKAQPQQGQLHPEGQMMDKNPQMQFDPEGQMLSQNSQGQFDPEGQKMHQNQQRPRTTAEVIQQHQQEQLHTEGKMMDKNRQMQFDPQGQTMNQNQQRPRSTAEVIQQHQQRQFNRDGQMLHQNPQRQFHPQGQMMHQNQQRPKSTAEVIQQHQQGQLHPEGQMMDKNPQRQFDRVGQTLQQNPQRQFDPEGQMMHQNQHRPKSTAEVIQQHQQRQFNPQGPMMDKNPQRQFHPQGPMMDKNPQKQFDTQGPMMDKNPHMQFHPEGQMMHQNKQRPRSTAEVIQQHQQRQFNRDGQMLHQNPQRQFDPQGRMMHQNQQKPTLSMIQQQQRQCNPQRQLISQNQQRPIPPAEVIRQIHQEHIMLQSKRVQQHQHPHPLQQHPVHEPRGMNLSVPLREPSPEPVQLPPKEPEVPPATPANEEEPSDIDIQFRNISCNYMLPFHIDLKTFTNKTHSVMYEPTKGAVTKQMRSPRCYVKIHSSGKVIIVGCQSETDCKRAARCSARLIQKVMEKKDQRVSIQNYRINNVMATCCFPFGIKIEEIALKYRAESTYEPELTVGLVWKSTTPKATVRIHTTGSIQVLGASSEADVIEVLTKIYTIVVEYRCEHRAKRNVAAQKKGKRKAPVSRGPAVKRERLVNTNYGSSGVVNNKVYFSDEDEDLNDDSGFAQ